MSNTNPTRRNRWDVSSSRSATVARMTRTPAGAHIAALLTAAGHTIAGHAIVKDDADLVRGAIERHLASPDVQAIITTGGTGITSRDSTYEAVSAIAAQKARRLRRVVPHAQLRTDWPRRDDEPGVRRPRRRPHRRLAARIGSRRSPRYGKTRDPRVWDISSNRRDGDVAHGTPHVAPGAVTMRPFTSTISLDEARTTTGCGGSSIERIRTGVARPRRGDAWQPPKSPHRSTLPPFARSAMDGYAVVATDTGGAAAAAPRTLADHRPHLHRRNHRAQRSSPARAPRSRLARQYPPAPMPSSWSSRRRKAMAMPCRFWLPRTAGQNIGRKAADIAAGDIVVRLGDVLSPSRIGALAPSVAATPPYTRSPAWRFSRQATKWWILAARSLPDKFTT